MTVPRRTEGQLRAEASTSYIAQRLLAVQQYIHTEQNAGLVLLLAAVVALVWANSPWNGYYFEIFQTKISLDLAIFSLSNDLRHWINDGLMAIFFFVVGLEIKRELVHGELGDLRRAVLPVAAALGGMVVPAAIYLALNLQGDGMRGWGIPMATDIAFALGVLALAAPKAPPGLRIFLLTLAVVDDIGAILVIALFYAGELSLLALVAGAIILGALYLLRRLGLRDYRIYGLIGVLFWLAVLESGVHATIAGVILGLLTPAKPFLRPAEFAAQAEILVRDFRTALTRDDADQAEAILGELEAQAGATEAPVEHLERHVHPWASYAILPLFALANAGVALSAEALSSAVGSPVTQGIFFGLLLGKPIGIVGASWLMVKLRVALLPPSLGWRLLSGAGALAGIGFTVSLFINDLAFSDPALSTGAKVGIFAASLAAAGLGFLILRGVAVSPVRADRG